MYDFYNLDIRKKVWKKLELRFMVNELVLYPTIYQKEERIILMVSD